VIATSRRSQSTFRFLDASRAGHPDRRTRAASINPPSHCLGTECREHGHHRQIDEKHHTERRAATKPAMNGPAMPTSDALVSTRSRAVRTGGITAPAR